MPRSSSTARGEDAVGLIRLKLEQVAPDADANEIPDSFVELLLDRSSGNPFYIEELISFIASQGVDPTDSEAVRHLELPDSLHSLVLSRIDSMSDGPRRTLKVASVVGRVFEAPVLPGAYPELGTLDEVLERLAELRAADLIALDRDLEHAYLFKHVATQEVAYESLPFGLRARLHGLVGTWFESSDPDGVDRRLDLLAYHFWLSDDDERKRLYLGRAADAARTAYANASAISYLERLVPLLDGAPQVEAQLKLAKVLQVVGELGRAEAVAGEARSAAEALGDPLEVAWADASLAETAKRQSHFEAATVRPGRRARDVPGGEGERRVGHAPSRRGRRPSLQGDYPAAKSRYEDSRSVREEIGTSRAWRRPTATSRSAEFDGDPRRAGDQRPALALRRQVGDRRGIGIGEMNAGYYRILNGDLESARRHLQEALRLSRELGDRAMVAHSTFTLGNAERDSGDLRSAAARYADALQLQRELDDRFSLTFIIEDVGVLLARAGNEEQGRAWGFEVVRPDRSRRRRSSRAEATGTARARSATRADAAVARGAFAQRTRSTVLRGAGTRAEAARRPAAELDVAREHHLPNLVSTTPRYVAPANAVIGPILAAWRCQRRVPVA